jgi:hypothetical protein
MPKNEWFTINYGGNLDGMAQLVYRTYEEAKENADKYPVLKLVVDKSWKSPEEKWVTPTDWDAKHRPTVEVRFLGDWHVAVLLAVIERDNIPFYVVAEGACGTKVEIYEQCRMRSSYKRR